MSPVRFSLIINMISCFIFSLIRPKMARGFGGMFSTFLRRSEIHTHNSEMSENSTDICCIPLKENFELQLKRMKYYRHPMLARNEWYDKLFYNVHTSVSVARRRIHYVQLVSQYEFLPRISQRREWKNKEIKTVRKFNLIAQRMIIRIKK